MPTPPPRTLPQVIGHNVRRIRLERRLTQDAIAAACRGSGLRGAGSRIAQIEAGDIAPTLPNVVRLAAALSALGGAVTLPDLLQSEGAIQLADDPDELVTSDQLVAFLAGWPADDIGAYLRAVPDADAPRPGPLTPLPPGVSGWGRADERTGRQLGLRKRAMQELTRSVWGWGLEAERERRVNETGRARGAITAELKEELVAELERRQAAKEGPA
jgi:transcriptional regulator with XRE-family HTH domain